MAARLAADDEELLLNRCSSHDVANVAPKPHGSCGGIQPERKQRLLRIVDYTDVAKQSSAGAAVLDGAQFLHAHIFSTTKN